MRRILYLGYRNIVIAAIVLIVISLIVVVPLSLRHRTQATKKGYDAHN
jgi:competence protein ComGC